MSKMRRTNPTVRMVMTADKQQATSPSLVAVLPGIGATDDVLIVNTHSDGPNFAALTTQLFTGADAEPAVGGQALVKGPDVPGVQPAAYGLGTSPVGQPFGERVAEHLLFLSQVPAHGVSSSAA